MSRATSKSVSNRVSSATSKSISNWIWLRRAKGKPGMGRSVGAFGQEDGKLDLGPEESVGFGLRGSPHMHGSPRLGVACGGRRQVSRAVGLARESRVPGVHPTSAAAEQCILGCHRMCLVLSVPFYDVARWEEVKIDGGQQAVESEGPGRTSEIQVAVLSRSRSMNVLMSLGLRVPSCRSQH